MILNLFIFILRIFRIDMSDNNIKIIKKYKWKYKYDVEKNLFSVIPRKKDKRPKPKTLFKYYPLNKDSIDALKEQYIYAPHPFQLNDPFDCYNGLIDFDNEENINSFYKLKGIEKHIDDDIRFLFHKELYSEIGIISMTESFDNFLMWSYYNEHKGYCIEFDYIKLNIEMLGVFQINYQDNIEQISFKYPGLSMLYQSNIKNKVWKHEKEWRLLVYKKGKERKLNSDDKRKFKYDKVAIKSITLGNKFFQDNEISLRETDVLIELKNNEGYKNKVLEQIINNNIETYIMQRNKRTFSLEQKRFKIMKVENNKYIIVKM